MSRWEHRYLGDDRFPEMLSALEIEHFFTLDQGELASVRERRGPLNRLALALQIGFLKMTGRTLNSVELIPAAILDHLGRHLDCVPPRIASVRAFYRRRRRTLFEHHEAALRKRVSKNIGTRRRYGCSDVRRPAHMPSAGWWPIFAGKRQPCSTRPT